MLKKERALTEASGGARKKNHGQKVKHRIRIMEVTLTAQVGGSDAGKVCNPLIVSLRKSLKLIQDDYSSGLDKFKLQIRISGEVSKYEEKTGIHHIKLMKKGNYIIGEMVLGREIWTNKTTIEIVIQICDYTELLFLSIIKKLKKNKIFIEEERLVSDLKEVVINKFKKEYNNTDHICV